MSIYTNSKDKEVWNTVGPHPKRHSSCILLVLRTYNGCHVLVPMKSTRHTVGQWFLFDSKAPILHNNIWSPQLTLAPIYFILFFFNLHILEATSIHWLKQIIRIVKMVFKIIFNIDSVWYIKVPVIIQLNSVQRNEGNKTLSGDSSGGKIHRPYIQYMYGPKITFKTDLNQFQETK